MEQKGKDHGSSREIDWMDWWIGSVGMTFFPLLSSMLISFLRYEAIDISALIGSGELVMCAFLILASPISEIFSELMSGNFPNKSKRWKLFTYLLLLVAALELISYGAINTNLEEPKKSVYIVSFIFVFASISMAWSSKNLPKGA